LFVVCLFVFAKRNMRNTNNRAGARQRGQRCYARLATRRASPSSASMVTILHFHFLCFVLRIISLFALVVNFLSIDVCHFHFVHTGCSPCALDDIVYQSFFFPLNPQLFLLSQFTPKLLFVVHGNNGASIIQAAFVRVVPRLRSLELTRTWTTTR
jgi:hypothetical protein